MRLRPRVEVLCFRDDKVLVAEDPEKHYLFFPGGGVDPKESVLDGARREAFEESDRYLRAVTVAHPPTVQLWPDDYTRHAEGRWGKGYQGGFTHWCTAVTTEHPVHAMPDRHKDYEEFSWRPITEVIAALKKEVNGDWADDVRTRLQILTHQTSLYKQAGWTLPLLELRTC
jgi:8-oxo-dGTP pyrophosphatase MutT (NUDIX family)